MDLHNKRKQLLIIPISITLISALITVYAYIATAKPLTDTQYIGQNHKELEFIESRVAQ